MNNGEKYKDEIIDEYQNLLEEKVIDGDGNRMNRAIKEIAYKYCGMRLVGAFSTFKWLFEEYKEPTIKLRKLEYEILNYILNNTDYRFIVRDCTGKIFILTHEPTKDLKGGYWGVGEGRYENASFLKDLFQFVKWIDDKPTSIKDILDNCIIK